MRGVFILVLNHKDNTLLSNCRDFNGLDDFFLKLPTGGITKRENEVKGIALVFSELRKGAERWG